MNKHFKLFVLTALSATILTACGTDKTKPSTGDVNTGINKEEAKKEEVKKIVKFTEAEEAKFNKEFSEQVLNLESPIELTKKLDENIEKLSKKSATMAVDGVMYATVNNFMNLKLSEDAEKKIEELSKEGIDLNSIDEIEKLKDLDFKTFIRTVHLSNLKIQPKSDEIVKIDFQRFITKYSANISTDLIDLLEFQKQENIDKVVSEDGKTLLLDETVAEIMKLEALSLKHKDSYYFASFNMTKSFYLGLYLGVNGNYVFNETTNFAKAEVIAHYKKVITDSPKSELASKLKKYLPLLEATEYIKTEDIDVALLDLADIEYETITDKELEEAENEADIESKIDKVLEERKGK